MTKEIEGDFHDDSLVGGFALVLDVISILNLGLPAPSPMIITNGYRGSYPLCYHLYVAIYMSHLAFYALSAPAPPFFLPKPQPKC